MSFLALESADILGEESQLRSASSKVFIYPAPNLRLDEYPTIWIDLHLSDDGYEVCGEDQELEFITQNGKRCISIRPRMSLRLKTIERIGTSRDLTGVVTNVASMAVRGLLVIPGKVDPGFAAKHLTLVVSNLSKKSIDIGVNDKVASIAFAKSTEDCVPTNSLGWGDKKIVGYTRSKWARFKLRIRSVDFFEVVKSILLGALGAAIAFIIKHYFEKVVGK